jgi:RimJ/RimL family protein N-acetyltransferase
MSSAGNPHWPFFGLRVTTPRLELRYPDDDDAVRVADLAARGVHPPDYMPFSFPWTDEQPPLQQTRSVQFLWRARGTLMPEAWTLPMAVMVDGEPVGLQDVGSVPTTDFRVTKAVQTGSWLGQAHQGQGIGKEMRAAILHLAFAGLGAEVAFSGAFVDNHASIAVSRALGYEDDGFEVHERKGEAARQIRFRMERAAWEARGRHDIEISGLEPCLPLLGLSSPQA